MKSQNVRNYYVRREHHIPVDFILLKLDQSIEFDYKTTAPIPLKRWNTTFNEKLQVAGFGKHVVGTDIRKPRSYVIGTLTVKPNSGFCNATRNEFCAYGKAEGSFKGDSGGPVFKVIKGKPYQVGMTIYGEVYTDKTDTWAYAFGRYLNIGTNCHHIKRWTNQTVKCV
uniref:Peptidase S1 domain-containing protein n=1 Tax=Panagrellus redivivus TaxID=6233 RepID=A0A7E4V3S2_PANRE